ncbi:MAG: UDP-N-acetylglucosamine 2-epimerase (non-hydrolyzing), partial [Candidatus Omnitrophota bacterium]
LTGVLADYYFAPTLKAKQNLLREGVDESRIYVTGNTVIDSLLYIVKDNYEFVDPVLKNINFEKKIILLTIHRRENFGKPLRDVCYAVKDIVGLSEQIEVVCPVHLNPNVSGVVRDVLGGNDKIHLIEPLDYKAFVHLMNKSYLILTDSGGIQEEAPSLKKPVLVLRSVTERPEAIEAGTARLVGTNRQVIVSQAQKLLEDKDEYNKMSAKENPYGDGKAGERIADILREVLL